MAQKSFQKMSSTNYACFTHGPNNNTKIHFAKIFQFRCCGVWNCVNYEHVDF